MTSAGGTGFHSWLGRALGIATVWAGVAAISAFAVLAVHRGQDPSPGAGRVFVEHLFTWQPWGLFTAVALFLARRWPLDGRVGDEPGDRGRALGIHGAVGAFWLLLDEGFLRALAALGLEPFPGSRWPLGVILVLLVFGGAHFLQSLGRQRSRGLQAHRLERRASDLQRQLEDAQVQFLQAQLHPHFLFNALNAVVGLTRRGENQAAVTLLTGVGDLLRYALAQSDEPLVPLSREVYFARRYLEIQRARFGDLIDCRFAVGKEEAARFVPALLLQPLLENAIEHGSPSPEARRLIEVKARLDEPWLGPAIIWLCTRQKSATCCGPPLRRWKRSSIPGSSCASIALPWSTWPSSRSYGPFSGANTWCISATVPG